MGANYHLDPLLLQPDPIGFYCLLEAGIIFLKKENIVNAILEYSLQLTSFSRCSLESIKLTGFMEFREAP